MISSAYNPVVTFPTAMRLAARRQGAGSHTGGRVSRLTVAHGILGHATPRSSEPETLAMAPRSYSC